MAYTDLEKPYDRPDRNTMGRVMNMYEVNGMLSNVIRSFYAESEACGMCVENRVNG